MLHVVAATTMMMTHSRAVTGQLTKASRTTPDTSLITATILISPYPSWELVTVSTVDGRTGSPGIEDICPALIHGPARRALRQFVLVDPQAPSGRA